MSSPNTSVFPVSYQVEPDGEVMLGGVSIRQLIQTYGTPLYVLDETTLRKTMQAYSQAFSQYPAGLTILYAAKANLSMGLCRLIHSEGLGLDVVSGGEFYTALKAGFPTEKILFNGNNKSREELALAIHNGVGRISVDNVYELSLIDAVAREQNKKVPVILRVTPGIECHTHDYIKTGRIDSKFGLGLNVLDEVVQKILADYSGTIELTGLHAHIGSQIFETQPYVDLVEVMLDQFQHIRERYGLTLTHLNMGGGLGIQYQQTDDPPDVAEYARLMIDKLVAYAQKLNFPLPHLFLEPGRSLVATAGVTLYQVGSIKPIPELDKTYVSVDGGMGDNIRPALYGAKYTALVANKIQEPHTKRVTLAGKYCESGDVLITDFAVPESIAPGDWVMVFATGAYNYSMASNYNRVPRPATVMVQDGQSRVLVQREQWDDLIRLDWIS